MPGIVIVGTQWGDEGKGKVTDLLAERADLVVRVQDLLDAKILRKKVMAALEQKKQALRSYARDPRLDLHTITEDYLRFGHRLEPYIADTARLCWEALDDSRTVIFEGAQAATLDLDHGTYPFV